MNTGEYLDLKKTLCERGYEDEISWAENVQLCSDSDTFGMEAIWVILNAGMKMQVARLIQSRIMPFLLNGESASGGFKHRLKCRAIDCVWNNRCSLFAAWVDADDKLAFCESLPHIGPITKYHLARNLGLEFCKPDRHLVRIAGDETPHALCQRLADETGDRIGVVDCVIWRCANLGMI